MTKYWTVFCVFLVATSAVSSSLVDEKCYENQCSRLEERFSVDGFEINLVVQDGRVNIQSASQGDGDSSLQVIRIAHLNSHFLRYVERLEELNQGPLAVQELFQYSKTYIENIALQIKKLKYVVSSVEEKSDSDLNLSKALSQFDLFLVKKILAQESPFDSYKKGLSAYHLAALQKVDKQYRQSYKNYVRAVFADEQNSSYLNEAGFMAHILKEYEKSIAYYQKALAIDIETFGEAHRKVALRRNNLAGVYHSMGKYEEAVAYYEQALSSDLATSGAVSLGVATKRNNLGGVYEALGEFDRAINYYTEALTTFKTVLGEAHPNTARVKNNLQSAIEAQKKLDL